MALTIERIGGIIEASVDVKRRLAAEQSKAIYECGQLLIAALQAGGKILLCGNGGSAADAQHIAAELVVRFRSAVERPALAAMALTVDPSIASAGGNDIGFEHVFARCVEAYGRTGDVLVAISTSGNSSNVLHACREAHRQKMRVVGLLGGTGGALLSECDIAVVVPSAVTARVQESHITVGHIWCEMIEEALFPALFA
jgi:D-sedoheptulose 7-phosphate isomerase